MRDIHRVHSINLSYNDLVKYGIVSEFQRDNDDQKVAFEYMECNKDFLEEWESLEDYGIATIEYFFIPHTPVLGRHSIEITESQLCSILRYIIYQDNTSTNEELLARFLREHIELWRKYLLEMNHEEQEQN